MKLKDLLKDVKTIKCNGSLEIEIEDISCDSRNVSKNNLFVCIKGFKTDGNAYIKSAIEKGAICIVSEDDADVSENITFIKVENSRTALAQIANTFFDYPSKKFKLIGVTGTNGKTTTTYLIKSILEENGHKVGLVGTISNMIGEKVIHTERTTPDALELQRLFKQMVDEHIDTVIMEVSSQGLKLDRVYGCDFDIGVFTNLTRDHIGPNEHPTMEDYLNSKIKLFKMCKYGIINLDDEKSKNVIDESKCEVTTFGIEKEADIKAESIEITDKGVTFRLKYNAKMFNMQIPIPGKFTVYNILGAIGACIKLGLNIEKVVEGTKDIKGVPGRAEIVPIDRDFTVIIDFAHTPDALENILSSVKQYSKGRIVTLFGCGGDRDRAKRPIMGETAGRLSDYCIVTSDNPRSEEPEEIINQIEPGVKSTKCEYIKIVNRREAIEYALKNAQKNDIIILAGKGHEPYQILKDKTIHFDEREIVREILNTL
jgi:UDP-N-acetylmuramoyl-L-alanyl-D-glutamate--2,6-diaminopimelate ligase